MEAWGTWFWGPFAGHALVWRGLQQDGGPRHTGKEVEESVEEVAGVYVVDGRAPPLHLLEPFRCHRHKY
jgi:hypothetical protein